MPITTTIRKPLGLNSTVEGDAATEEARPASSTARRKAPSGEAAMREMLEAHPKDRVRVWDLRRSVEETRLPTCES